jgi:multidrug efflux pump subunit AcrA (membrane-fusion protein)
MPRVIALARPLLIIAAGAAVAFVMIGSRKPLEARSIDVPLPAVAVQVVSKSALPVTVIAHGNVRPGVSLISPPRWADASSGNHPPSNPACWSRRRNACCALIPDYELALAEAKQALATAEISLADAKALRQAARQDEARHPLHAAKARIARAQRDLRQHAHQRALQRAVIDEQRVELGQFMNAGTHLGRVLGADKAEIRLPIPPQDIGLSAALQAPG